MRIFQLSGPKIMNEYWLKQSGKPLFPDILWSRPETKSGAGKLLIIGGNQYGFGATGQAYAESERAGIGVVDVLLPDAVRKVAGSLLPDAEFAPSTPSGSFAHASLEAMLRLSQWADASLLAGDLGRNSETAIVLEEYVRTYDGLLIITQDAVEYFRETPLILIDRQRTCVVVSLSQLQKLFINSPHIAPITLGMGTAQLAEALHDYTNKHAASIITLHNDLLFVAHDGMVSTTHCNEQVWRMKYAARAAVFLLQSPAKPFEALTSAVID